MAKLPYMQFYPHDWSRDTACLSLSARGAWITIMCALWHAADRGKLSMPMAAWARLMGVSIAVAKRSIDELVKRAVCDSVTERNGDVTLVSRRMEREENARKQGAERSRRFREAQKFEERNGDVTPYISDIIYHNTDNKESKESVSSFDVFWAAYPKKTGKGAARRAWFKGRCAEHAEAIMAAVAWQSKQEQWIKERGQYIPHPATWLNQERWLDEPPATAVRTQTAETPDRRQQYTGTVREIVLAGRQARVTALTPEDYDRWIEKARDQYRAQPRALKEAFDILSGDKLSLVENEK